jgi:hypothetical protein
MFFNLKKPGQPYNEKSAQAKQNTITGCREVLNIFLSCFLLAKANISHSIDINKKNVILGPTKFYCNGKFSVGQHFEDLWLQRNVSVPGSYIN